MSRQSVSDNGFGAVVSTILQGTFVSCR